VTTIAHPAGADTLRLIRAAAAHGAPTLFHCGDEPLTTPLAIARAAAACADATIILGHMGGYFHVDDAIEVAERHRNVVLETSAMPYPAKIREAVERIGAERVIYASDGPACSPRIEVEKVRLAGLDPESERLVLGENARRMLDAVR
jgi:predicted TIM-barrel fold metal-dependent hydrolase